MSLQHRLRLSEGQLKNVFLLRRAYLQKQVLIQSQQHELQLQLADSTSEGNHRLHAATVSQAAHQMQENNVLLQEAITQYMGLIVDGVRAPSTYAFIGYSFHDVEAQRFLLQNACTTYLTVHHSRTA